MKRLIPVIVIVLAVVLVVAIVYVLRMPRTPDDHLSRALALERKLKTQIARLQSKGAEQNSARIAQLENKITRAYETVISRFPQSPQAAEAEYRLIANADRKDENAEEVGRRYEEFLKAHPDNRHKRDIIIRLAEMNLQKLKRPLAAIQWYETFVKELPQDDLADDALFQIAKIYEEIREYPSAVAALEKLLAQYPKSSLADEARYRIANLLAEKLQKYREAIESLSTLEKQASDSKYVLLARSQRESLEKQIVDKQSEEYSSKYYGGVGETSGIAQPLEEWNHPVIKQIREQGLDVQHYDIQIALNPGERATSAVVQMQLLATKSLPEREMILQLNPDLEISSLTSNGENLSFERKEQFVYIAMSRPIKAESAFALELAYGGQCVNSWKGDVISTQGVHLRPESKWYPMTWWGDTASCDLTISVPAPFRAVSVGELLGTEAIGNRAVFHWREDAQISSITLVAGELESYSEKTEAGFDIMCFAALRNASLAPERARQAKEILDFYASRFGSYPFKKLAIVEAPLFPGGYGAPSLVLLGASSFQSLSARRSLLAHELAHQWWGSTVLVALTEDSIPWLSEGFATYSDALYVESREGVEPFRQHLRQLARHFVSTIRYATSLSIRRTWWSSPMYHALTYEKGALVLHALRYVMGDEKFFAALRTYASAFAFRTATVQDFQSACEREYGESLEWFFKEWLDGESLPHFKVTEAIATTATSANRSDAKIPTLRDGAQEYRTRVIVRQMGDVFTMPVDVTLHCADNSAPRKRIVLESEEQSVEFSTPQTPQRVVLDEDFWVLSLSSPDELQRTIELLETR